MRIVLASLLLAATAHADPTWIHAELDPLTFANRGYGGQVGFRFPQLHGVRLAIASFSLHVPDPISQLGGNDGFDEKVEPSGAFYALYYFAAPGESGFALGASFRLLKLSFMRDDIANTEARVTEISPEAIIAYQWHPFRPRRSSRTSGIHLPARVLSPAVARARRDGVEESRCDGRQQDV